MMERIKVVVDPGGKPQGSLYRDLPFGIIRACGGRSTFKAGEIFLKTYNGLVALSDPGATWSTVNSWTDVLFELVEEPVLIQNTTATKGLGNA